MGLLFLLKIMLTMTIIGFLSLLILLCDVLLMKPERLRSKLRKQGIRGPPQAFLLGNIREIMKIRQASKAAVEEEEAVITHDCSSTIFPFLERWRKEYGPTFTFSLGNIQFLYMNQSDIVKETSLCTSLYFGKPSFEHKERGPLLGQGILTSNGAIWAHQRKILAPELYMDKVKGMMNLMVESSIIIVNSWNKKIESEGGLAEIEIDDYMRSFSGDVISRACFGSNYYEGKEIFLKLGALQEAMSKKTSALGIPGMRHLPTKSNRETWKLQKEVRSLILQVAKERRSAKSEDLLQKVLDATDGDLDQNATNQFIVDNCKNIYLAGYETTAVSATWTLMLLASNQEWQDRVRAEVLQVCGGQLPDAEMVRSMKTLTMVIHESLRLYPPVPVVVREALEDLKFGDIQVPKGVSVCTVIVALHQDPEFWGDDADKFNPERFANGVSVACKLPYLYMPFGYGPRTCLGQNFAMAELKILIALIVSSLSLSLSPKYRHSPARNLLLEPEHGVHLLITKL